MRKLKYILASIFGGYFVFSIALWVWSFADTAPSQDNCAFGSVSEAQFRVLLNEAQNQRWTVWPSLSNGLFYPSDRWLLTPTNKLREHIETQLLRHIKKIVSDSESPDRQIAGAHALMRSIRAEHVGVLNIPVLRQNKRLTVAHIIVDYFIPQRRFSPLCLWCFLWPTTTISIVFQHNVIERTHKIERTVVLNEGLKYTPNRERIGTADCPQLPTHAL